MLQRDRRISREIIKSLEKPIFFVNNKIVSMRVFENPKNGSNSKFSFSVSKKIEKKAVIRNKMRRSGYTIVRDNLNYIKDGYFIRFSFNSKYDKGVFDDNLRSSILEALDKAGLMLK